MKKIAIVGFHNLHLMQFLYKYTDILDKNNVDYDVLYWDRDLDSNIRQRPFNGKKVEFRYKMSNYQPKYKKILGFAKCIRFFCREIKKRQYSHVVLLTTQTALPLYLLSKNVRKSKYIYDYRDLTYEKFNPCKKIILKIIENSFFTSISSLGFKEILGDSKKFIVAHNCVDLALMQTQHSRCDKIRITYWGMVRQVEYNKRICDIFANDDRFILSYHGEGYNKELKKYCEDNKYSNIFFTGRYTTDEIESFVYDTDILLNAYENDAQQKLAMTVKLYDGIRYQLPMLIAKDSYMQEYVSNYSFALPIDLDCNEADKVFNWYRKSKIDLNDFEKLFNEIKQDEEIFKNRLLEFIAE